MADAVRRMKKTLWEEERKRKKGQKKEQETGPRVNLGLAFTRCPELSRKMQDRC